MSLSQRELSRRGHAGYFAPKPVSNCLECSDQLDGCALFVKLSQLEITSAEAVNYSLDVQVVDVI